MPIYEYKCTTCGFQKEFLRKVSDPVESECPSCGKPTFSKMVTAAGFQLKGTGWYVTDFRNSGAGRGAEAATGKSGGASSSSEPASSDAAPSAGDSAQAPVTKSEPSSGSSTSTSSGSSSSEPA